MGEALSVGDWVIGVSARNIAGVRSQVIEVADAYVATSSGKRLEPRGDLMVDEAGARHYPVAHPVAIRALADREVYATLYSVKQSVKDLIQGGEANAAIYAIREFDKARIAAAALHAEGEA